MDAASRQLGQCSTSGRSWLHSCNTDAHSGIPRSGIYAQQPQQKRNNWISAPSGSPTRRSRQSHRQLTRANLNGLGAVGVGGISHLEADFLRLATQIADSSAGFTAPHPNAGCVLVDSSGCIIAQAHQRAQGSESAETQAVRAAGPAAHGSTAYLNLETGDCHGDDASIRALIGGGVKRVVVGIKNPLEHSRGQAIKELRQAGVTVEVLQESVFIGDVELEEELHQACLDVNEALLHRAATGKPLGILKYAMTLDGKIATSSGHSAWVTAPASRARVFETRARSDAVIVGGQTVRRDNPRLTTRRESGHSPVRIVMSRTLELPPDANLWDINIAPTIVMTQRGARCDFQAHLLSRGVEVVQFDFLTPEAVASYCAERGFLQCLWECGGTLAAPAIAGGSIHKCLAFVAPKMVISHLISALTGLSFDWRGRGCWVHVEPERVRLVQIGGVRAPSPVGELGNVEMTQATELVQTSWEAIGRDMLMTGYLPSSGGPAVLEAALDNNREAFQEKSGTGLNTGSGVPQGVHMSAIRPKPQVKAVEFYKAWDRYGSLSNFSPHRIRMPDVLPTNGDSPASAPQQRSWQTLEHYYQAQKFSGVADARALALVEEIRTAGSPEEAARLGRTAQRTQPRLLRADWETAKLFVMYAGLQAKFAQNEGPRATLLSTAPMDLVEASPQDFFWGRGVDRSGSNHLGVLLMRVRAELQAAPVTTAHTIESVRPHGLASTVPQR